jgi:hypothetical protein
MTLALVGQLEGPHDGQQTGAQPTTVPVSVTCTPSAILTLPLSWHVFVLLTW